MRIFYIVYIPQASSYFTRAKPDGFGSCFLAYQRPACPDKQHAHDKTEGYIGGKDEPLTFLEQQEDVVRKGREGREAPTKARNEHRTRRWRERTPLFGKPKEDTYEQASHNIDHKGAEREVAQFNVATNFTRKETQCRSHKSATSGKKHHFQHIY